jgi:outer membrane biosynthesis protein TonB
MVVGFNHNFRYKGEVYHIQTEDSGVKSPNIVTLLYQGGTILASKKTSYADIAKVDNLEQVVEELMKEQHKNMLRSLKSGEYDDVIERFQAGKKVTPVMSEEESAKAPPTVEKPTAPEPQPQSPPQPAAPVAAKPKPVAAPAPAPVKEKPTPPSAVESSLDEVILSYLMGDE